MGFSHQIMTAFKVDSWLVIPWRGIRHEYRQGVPWILHQSPDAWVFTDV